jgi:hypothetical protein
MDCPEEFEGVADEGVGQYIKVSGLVFECNSSKHTELNNSTLHVTLDLPTHSRN